MWQGKLLLETCVILAFFLLSLDASQYTNQHTSQTRNGICTKEVPTANLIRPEDRWRGIPRGNGSREGYSKIQVCCSGWTRKSSSRFECEPICENGCYNGECIAPNVCICKNKYVMNENGICVPTCPIGCQNGFCGSTGRCSCYSGYALSSNRQYCIPHCSGGCGAGGKCVGPETCLCQKGYSINRRTNKCEYHCEGGCGGGTCVGPNRCSCKSGYKLQGGTCVANCPKGCKNGDCIANRCVCRPGWTLNKSGSTCTPHCSQTCYNGDCVAPNTCACKKGYVPMSGSRSSDRCVAYCSKGCLNASCTAPEFCLCNPGYKKANGVCVLIRY